MISGKRKPVAIGRGSPGAAAGAYYWPLTLAIVLLVGSVAGLVVATADFSNPRILLEGGWPDVARSGWAHLAGDLLLTIVLLGSAGLLRGVALRRFQFCVLLSVLAHFWLAVYLYARPLPLAVVLESQLGPQVADGSEPLLLPDYHWERIDAPADSPPLEEFDRPVPVEPSGPTERAKVAPQPPERDLPVSKPAPSEPDDLPRKEPERAPLRRAETPAPDRQETPDGAQISRQPLESRIDPGQPIPQPEIKPAEAPPPSAVDSRQAAAQRQAAASAGPPPQGAATAQAALPPNVEPVTPARRAWEQPPRLESPGDIAPPRQPAQPAELDRVQAEAPQPIGVAGPAPEVPLESNPATAARRPETPRGIGRGSGSAPPAAGSPGIGRPAVQPRRFEPAADQQLASADSMSYPRREGSGNAPRLGMPPIEEPAVMDSPSDALGSDGPMLPAIREPSTAARRAVTYPGGPGGGPSPSPGPIAGSGLSRLPGTAAGTGMTPRRVAEGEAGIGSERGGGGAAGSTGRGALARSGGHPGLPESATVAENVGVPGGKGRGIPGGTAGGIPGGSGRGLSGSSGTSPAGRPGAGGPGSGKLDAASGAGLAGPNPGLGGLPVRIEAPLGPGSLGRGSSAAIGLPGRPARTEGDLGPVSGSGASPRMAIGRSGGVPTIRGATGEDPREFFKQRSPDRRGRVGRAFGGTPQSEQAVERGIDYLVRHQFPDGRWSLDRFPQGSAPGYEDASPGQMNGDTAATGLALLAMLGAGYTHREGKHAAMVRRGIAWLVRNQQADGQLFTPETDQTRYTHSYGHAIAAIALCEAYGMTRDRGLRDPAQRAIQFILAAQHPERGGWRYEPQRESDTSVSGWKLMALKSAQMAGLQVPPETLQKVSHWLDLAQVQGGSRYVYNPYAADTPQQREGRLPNLAMTAEGLLMRMWLGWRRDNPALIEGVQFLAANLPEEGTPSEPRRDLYYWYYATQVMFQVQGDGWKAWNERLQALLPQGQVTEGPLAGSWHPLRPVADRWGHAGGRHYVTCLSLLMLEVYYRYLPLYQPLEE